jgi:hypothetical protein
MIGVLTKLMKTIIMLKNILKLEGTQKLTKNEQKSINGGANYCPPGQYKCYQDPDEPSFFVCTKKGIPCML